MSSATYYASATVEDWSAASGRVSSLILVDKVMPRYKSGYRTGIYEVEDERSKPFVFSLNWVEELGPLDQVWEFEWVNMCGVEVDVTFSNSCDTDTTFPNLSECYNLMNDVSTVVDGIRFAASYNAYVMLQFEYYDDTCL